MSNPLLALIVSDLKPAPEGGYIGTMLVSGERVHIPPRPSFTRVNQKKPKQKPHLYAGMSYSLYRDIESLAAQYPDGALGTLAKAILVIGRSQSKLAELNKGKES